MWCPRSRCMEEHKGHEATANLKRGEKKPAPKAASDSGSCLRSGHVCPYRHLPPYVVT